MSIITLIFYFIYFVWLIIDKSQQIPSDSEDSGTESNKSEEKWNGGEVLRRTGKQRLQVSCFSFNDLLRFSLNYLLTIL